MGMKWLQHIGAALLGMGTCMGSTTAVPPAAETDAFAVQVFSQLAKTQKVNIVYSPASLEGVLHLLRQGAQGNTAQVMDAIPMGEQNVARNITPVEANALFIAKDLQLNPDIKTDEIIPVAFKDSPTKAAKTINKWASKHTKKLIQQIVSASDLSPRTRLVAANAIYLKAEWSYPFDSENTNKRARFTTAGGERVKVQMMEQTEEFRYAEGDGWQAVALYYCAEIGATEHGKINEPEGEAVCFIGILPKGDARQFAAQLTPQQFQKIRSALAEASAQYVMVKLPKFKTDTGVVSLNAVLEACGLEVLFTPEANFRGFTNEPLQLSKVLQRCYVNVDEEGTEAAAVTIAEEEEGCCAMDEEPQPKKIIFNRPFIWVIGDLNSAAPPYFMGLFEKP